MNAGEESRAARELKATEELNEYSRISKARPLARRFFNIYTARERRALSVCPDPNPLEGAIENLRYMFRRRTASEQEVREEFRRAKSWLDAAREGFERDDYLSPSAPAKIDQAIFALTSARHVMEEELRGRQ